MATTFQSTNEVIVLDFETTGLSSDYDRIIEVGAVLVKSGKISNRFSQLMNPGFRVSSFISNFTGITNEMLVGKPRPEEVMPKLKRFIGGRPIVAHNASFDRRFLHAEMERAKFSLSNPVLCTVLLGRRLMPELTSYKLSAIAAHLDIVNENAHRALADAEATAHVWLHLLDTVKEATGIEEPELELFENIRSTPKARVAEYLAELR